jgi:hypothetical protein
MRPIVEHPRVGLENARQRGLQDVPIGGSAFDPLVAPIVCICDNVPSAGRVYRRGRRSCRQCRVAPRTGSGPAVP